MGLTCKINGHKWVYSKIIPFNNKNTTINKHSIRTCDKCDIKEQLISISSVFESNDYEEWKRIDNNEKEKYMLLLYNKKLQKFKNDYLKRNNKPLQCSEKTLINWFHNHIEKMK